MTFLRKERQQQQQQPQRKKKDNLVYPRDFASHGDERPVRKMIFSWVCCILVPAATIAWTSTKRWSIVCGVTIATPALAILQGAIGMLSYRAHFADAPLPQTPSHGVVVVHPDDQPQEAPKNTNTTTTTKKQQQPQCYHHHHHLQRPIAGIPLSSLCDGSCECTSVHITNQHSAFLRDSMNERPIRMLVIGDSLAIGVGQEKSSTPVMPEAIAKTISKLLDGRVVYWSCHGAPGASTPWIVREIERGARRKASLHHGDDDDDEVCGSDVDLDSLPGRATLSSSSSSGSGSGSDTEATSSDEEDSDSSEPRSGFVSATATNEQCIRHNPSLSVWKERLTQHRKRFQHPEVLGPYDIVICLTGSNDLKGAVFPFLLTGEDAEFRRQAKKIGGYPKQLEGLMKTLNDNMKGRLLNEKMQRRLETIRQRVGVATETVRETVEVATETVRGKVEETMEYISPGRNSRLNTPRSEGGRTPTSLRGSSQTFFAEEKEEDDNDDDELDTSTRSESRHPFPLIVLPGMPSRSLPCFQKYPLRLLSVPFVDIMDMHKRNFAKQYPGKVLFVPPPAMKDLSEYEDSLGEMWSQREREKTVLALRDIRRRDSSRIEGNMRHFYQAKKAQRKIDLRKARLPLLSHIADPSPGAGLFCVDQIHPRDEGYDFWGRYLGNSIAKEIQLRHPHL